MRPQLKRRLGGATVALLLGIAAVLIGLMYPEGPLMLDGVVAAIGSVAYRSAKRASLGLVGRTVVRQLFEVAGLAVAIGGTVAQTDFLHVLRSDPVSNLLLPAWVVLAYGIARFGVSSSTPP